jgi:hypothetical protein
VIVDSTHWVVEPADVAVESAVQRVAAAHA